MNATVETFIAARAAAGRARAMTQAISLHRRIEDDAADDAGMVAGGSAVMDAPPLSFHLRYRDARQQVSGRCITLRGLSQDDQDIKILALCHLRGALRTFVASRIVEITDLTTGEIHVDGAGFFRQHPLLRAQAPKDAVPPTPEMRAIEACRDEIVILSFVAAADGDVAASERDEILKHVLLSVDDPLNEAAVRRHLQGWLADELAFTQAIARLCAGQGRPKALMRSLRRVIDADGEVDPEEVGFVHEVQTRLWDAGRL